MKYFIIAGEASGDLHASKLVSAIKEKDSVADFAFIGGNLMSSAADKSPIQHFSSMNYMGLFAVLRNISSLIRILKRMKSAILEYNPDVLILVDYAGFNLRMAKFASLKGLKVFYYISPKVWAWRKSRVKKLKRYVDKLFVIFPFEVEFFRAHGMEVEYNGNPLMDAIEDFNKKKLIRSEFLKSNKLNETPVIALLAGSRKQEITNCLPEMIKAVNKFPDYQIVVAGAPSVDPSVYEEILKGTAVNIVYNDTYNLLSVSTAAIVTSGTATLETALLDVPQIVVYKTGNLTYRLAQLFVNFEFFSLVNLVFSKELVKEILQFNLAEKIQIELEKILNDAEYRSNMKLGYAKIKGLIGESGVSKRVADKMIELL
ncbi:MAG: lipid-A-disaccharide synthase [Bacteroidales bacterium]|jgi:lipid-A-disaccharide synthase|nr:lipid-A-disaccharide synthase [Bacteroidales bacterium]